LYVPVPQAGHTPLGAGRPFFILTSTAFAISRFALHFTQQASAILLPLCYALRFSNIAGNAIVPRMLNWPAS
jgi:hypothetical protein